MGQKTHPKGFRLITTQKYLSYWYTNKYNYSNFLKEDIFIRLFILKFYTNIYLISKIELNRFSIYDTTLNIFIRIPSFRKIKSSIYKKFKLNNEITQEPKIIKELKIKLNLIKQIKDTRLDNVTLTEENKNFFILLLLNQLNLNLIKTLSIKTQKNYKINYIFIYNLFTDVRLIAKFIEEQLQQRIPFRRILNKTLGKIKNKKIIGIKIQFAGRLNGIEIARTEWKRWGRIPLHTLNTKLDYISYPAKTMFGIIGIKIWFFISTNLNSTIIKN